MACKISLKKRHQFHLNTTNKMSSIQEIAIMPFAYLYQSVSVQYLHILCPLFQFQQWTCITHSPQLKSSKSSVAHSYSTKTVLHKGAPLIYWSSHFLAPPTGSPIVSLRDIINLPLASFSPPAFLYLAHVNVPPSSSRPSVCDKNSTLQTAQNLCRKDSLL